MTDNPKKPASRPRTVQMSDEEFEQFYEEIYREFGPANREKDEDLTRDLPIRNYSNDYGRTPAPQPADRNPAPNASRATYVDNNRVVPPAKKDNSIKYLTIAVCLECLGIVGVVLWWVLMIL